MQQAHIIILLCKNLFIQNKNIYFSSSSFSFESSEDNLNVCVTTKACSFGKTVVEKLEVCYLDYLTNHNYFLYLSFYLQNGTTKYNDIIGKCIHRSNDTTMCSFMVDFIKKLKSGMYMREMMNVVLEHLGVLQVNN
jgi:hypothetical protein